MADKTKKKSWKNDRSKKSEAKFEQLIDGTYRVGRQIGAGSYGQIRVGTNVHNASQTVAIKLEKIGDHIGQLQNEQMAYSLLKGKKGFPTMFYFGRYLDYQVLVIEMLGRDLESCFEKCNRHFTLKSMLFLTLQLLKRFEDIHQVGLIYRDVKPENFMIGIRSNTVYVIDFGLSKKYNDSRGRHIASGPAQELIGTTRYMSANAHLGNETSRRDDLESLGYVFAYFLRGKLPWSGLKACSPREHNMMVCSMKQNTSEEKLVEGSPSEFITYLKYVRTLAFDAAPNYEKIRNMFKRLFHQNNFSDDGIFDWNR